MTVKFCVGSPSELWQRLHRTMTTVHDGAFPISAAIGSSHNIIIEIEIEIERPTISLAHSSCSSSVLVLSR